MCGIVGGRGIGASWESGGWGSLARRALVAPPSAVRASLWSMGSARGNSSPHLIPLILSQTRKTGQSSSRCWSRRVAHPSLVIRSGGVNRQCPTSYANGSGSICVAGECQPDSCNTGYAFDSTISACRQVSSDPQNWYALLPAFSHRILTAFVTLQRSRRQDLHRSRRNSRVSRRQLHRRVVRIAPAARGRHLHGFTKCFSTSKSTSEEAAGLETRQIVPWVT